MERAKPFRVILGEGLMTAFDWIVINESDSKSLMIADNIRAGFEESSIVDLDHFYKAEREEADLLWQECFDPAEADRLPSKV